MEGPSTGSVIWNEVPTPCSLSTVIVPPWASTTSFTIFVPSPVPPTLRLIAWYVKRLSRTSGDIPFPVSIDRQNDIRSRLVLAALNGHRSTRRHFGDRIVHEVIEGIEESALIGPNLRQGIDPLCTESDPAFIGEDAERRHTRLLRRRQRDREQTEGPASGP